MIYLCAGTLDKTPYCALAQAVYNLGADVLVFA
jgi:hypothetical protein